MPFRRPSPRSQPRLADDIVSGNVTAWYQPVIDLSSGRLVGLEALARWTDDDAKAQGAGRLVKLAEETGSVVSLDRSIADQACRDLARWHDIRPDLRLGLNVSGRHLDEADWPRDIQAIVSGAGVAAETIDLELTETVRPSAPATTATGLATLREAGFSVWLDDFGSGWSQLRHLLELPIDGLKIDHYLATAPGARAEAVLRLVLATARELGLRVTIEGIGSIAQADRACALGCTSAQGFLWSAAVPAERIDELVFGAWSLDQVWTPHLSR